MFFRRKSPDEKPEISDLLAAFLCPKNKKEMFQFLRDLCTASEIDEMAKRFAAAKMFDAGKTIREISEKTGLSTTTVSRVGQWKKNIGEGGYDLVLSRMK